MGFAERFFDGQLDKTGASLCQQQGIGRRTRTGIKKASGLHLKQALQKAGNLYLHVHKSTDTNQYWQTTIQPQPLRK